METRQRGRGAGERGVIEEEWEQGKGKSPLDREPPITIWDIEDDSDEKDEGGSGKRPKEMQKRSFKGSAPQAETNSSMQQVSEDRRSGLRKRGRPLSSGQSKTQKGDRDHGKTEYEEGGNSGRRQQRQTKPKRTVMHQIRAAEKAFQKNADPDIRRIMQYLEEEAIQEQSADEMEEWATILHDPGHTRGRRTLFKQSLHMYWVMKGLMAKALEQVAKEMADLLQKKPDMSRELSYIRTTLSKQEDKLDEILCLLKGERQDPVQEDKQPNPAQGASRPVDEENA